ncbi:MAG: F0F1 ATP synthase subunit A [Chitinispirillaceae bacterium]|nr:F0F1 ATP synthase subunit A [Chitinispirillaceae bacterium]
MKIILIIITTILILTSKSFASESTGNENNAKEALISHISDSHKWQIFPFMKEISLPDIKVGRLNIPVTRYVVMLWTISAMLILILIPTFKNTYIVPSGMKAIFEPILLFVKDSIVFPSMGELEGKKWLPFFYTLFLFLLFSNLLGLIPLFSKVTANLSVTAALASMIFVLLIGSGIKKNGFLGFFKGMIPSGIPLPFGIFILLIEIPSLIIRCCVLAIRLFANMIAGHFVSASLLLLIFLLHPLVATISVPMAIFIDLLEILVAIIQALVFTMLSAIFIGSAITHH